MSFRRIPYALDISKLNMIVAALSYYNVPNARWFHLGLKLDLLYPKLKDIEANHSDVARCLLVCLNLWLTTATTGPHTWDRLAIALDGIEETAAAENIRKTMADPASQLLQQYSDKLSQIALPKELVQLLHTEGVISKETVAKVKSCGGLLAGDPLIAVYTAVAKDHDKLRVLATVLCRFDQTQSLAKELLDHCGQVIPEATSYSQSSKAQPSDKQTTPTERRCLLEETDMGQEMIEPPAPGLPFFNEDKDCPPSINFDIKSLDFTEDMGEGLNTILMTASDKELHAVLAKAEPLEKYGKIIDTMKGDVQFYLGMYGKCKVAIVQTSQGQHDILSRLPKLLKEIKAKFVISVGVCYGMREDDKVKLGDVIVAEQMFDYTDERTTDEGKRHFVSHEVAIGGTLKDLFRTSAGFEQKRSENDSVLVHFGLIISIPKLVKDDAFKADVLSQAPNALAGEMEGTGISKTIRIVPECQFITIKAVADWGTKDKKKCKGWKPFSAHAAAKFVHFRMNTDLAYHTLEQKV